MPIPVVLSKLPPDYFSFKPLEMKSVSQDGLRVEFKRQEYDADTGETKFIGGVKAFYGPTELVTDTLIVNYKTKVGRAIGKVVLTDPDGNLSAEDLTFDWQNKRGVANRVRIRVGRSTLIVDKIEINPENDPGYWVLYNVRATPSTTRPPEYMMTAKKARLLPGRSGKVNDAGIEIFGFKLGTIPYYNFSLDKRVTGFRLPAPTFVRGAGIGVAWNSAFLLNDQTGIFGRIGSVPGSLPSTIIEVTQSPLDPEKFLGKLSTRPDYGDRLSDSFIDNIAVLSAEREIARMRRTVRTTSFGTYWNITTKGRKEDAESLSKAYDLAHEIGQPVGSGGFLAQARVQRIRGANQETWKDRGVVQLVGHTGLKPISNKFGGFIRVDSNAFFDRGSQFAYARVAGVLVFTPVKQFQLSSAYVHTFEAGHARYQWDRLSTRRGVTFRADMALGPLLGSTLLKYDFDLKDWASVEYGFSLISGSFEPYFRYRQNPKETEFGIRIRVNDLFDRLSSRAIKRVSDTKGSGPK